MTITPNESFMQTRARHIAETQAYTPEAIAHLDWTREQVEAKQTRRLRQVVAHAQKNSPFYAERLKGVDANTITPADLINLPVVTKADVMEHWDDLVTDRRLTLKGIVAHLDDLVHGRSHNPYYLDGYFAAATGGTSGKRGVFLWDWETAIITSNINYRMEAREDAANPPPMPRRTAVICAKSYVHASRFLFPKVLDPQRETLVLSADMSLSTIVTKLNEFQPDHLVGYASIVQELTHEQRDGRLRIQPRRVSTNSEPLFDEARQLAKEIWGIHIRNSWGSVEIGLSATEGPISAASDGGITLAEDFLIFELVDRNNQPVADLTAGDCMLVTKLYGTAMPLIRYEMTDTLVLDDGPNPDAPGYRRIKSIKGRSDAWFIYNDNTKIHPMVVRSVLGQQHSIIEYQARQTPTGVDVLAVVHGELNLENVTNMLATSLTNAGLADPTVHITSVDVLPRHPETNKLTHFVPLKHQS